MPTFTVSYDDKVLGTYEIDKKLITIGRARDNTISIANKAISRHHVRVEEDGGGYYAVDLGSLNGTFVNDETIQRVKLRTGDRLTIGAYVVLFDEGAGLRQAPAAQEPAPQPEVADTETMRAGRGQPASPPIDIAEAAPPPVWPAPQLPADIPPVVQASAKPASGPPEVTNSAAKTALTLEDKIRAVILEQPFMTNGQIRKRLSEADYGEKIGGWKLRKVLKALDLDTKVKRYQHFTHA